MATALSNAPAEPYDAFRLHIEDLFEQAQQFLDGEPIETEQQAEDVSRLLNMLRKAHKDADEQRKVEKRPHDEAARAVQARWQPLLGKVDLAETTAKNALAPFLRKKDEAQRAAAEALRQEAEEAARLAAQTIARPDDLAGQATARIRQENAAELAKKAARLDKAKAHAKGGERAVGLRSVWTPELVDPCAALKHYRERQPEALKAWLLDQAQKDVRAGARAIPGFNVNEARVAV